MQKALFVFFGLYFVLVLKSQAQFILRENSVAQVIRRMPAFTIYKDNFFITGITLGEKVSKYNADAKYQISFKQRLLNAALPFKTSLFLTYSQKSFWDIYTLSSPFAETNYNPGLALGKLIFKNGKLIGRAGITLEHESNGKDSLNSRSWNFISFIYLANLSAQTQLTLKAWLPFLAEENADLTTYIGYGEARFSWIILENKLHVDIYARKGAAFDWKGSLQTEISFKPFKSENQFVMVQWWQGHAESLIHYQESTSHLRIGMVIKPTYYNLY